MIDLFERIKLLKQSSIFTDVETDDLRFVAQCLQEEIYYKGDRIFDINDYGEELYILTSGKVGISLIPAPDTENFIAILEPGDCFGEMNLLDGLPRSASAHVLADSTLLILSKANLRGLIISYPEISLGMLRSLSLKLRQTNKLSSS